MSLDSLPNELCLAIASKLDAKSLARFEGVSVKFKLLLLNNDALLWTPFTDTRKGCTLRTYIEHKQAKCLDSAYWDDIRTWKDATVRYLALERNWRSNRPAVRVSLLGSRLTDEKIVEEHAPVVRSLRNYRPLHVPCVEPGQSHVWRAKLDTAEDAKFVIVTRMSGGLFVVDARPEANGAVLWSHDTSNARRRYIHLEYHDGIACWDSDDGIEVYKRYKLVYGHEPAEKRGHFIRVGVISDIRGTRGFMLNADQHLAISTDVGTTSIYDVSGPGQRRMHSFPIESTATGHVLHDSTYSIYALGTSGYALYHKMSNRLVGKLNFADEALASALERCEATNWLHADYFRELTPVNYEGHLHAHFTKVAVRPMTARRRPLQRPKLDLRQDEWGFAWFTLLADGGMLLVGRSRSGRILFCTDLLGLLTVIEDGNQEEIDFKVHQCLAFIETGETAGQNEFNYGGWLAIHGCRVAWEMEDRVYICDLPTRRNTTPNEKTNIITLNGRQDCDIDLPFMPFPVSYMSLHDDCILMTYFHSAYVHGVESDGTHRFDNTSLKSVRIVRYAPSDAQQVMIRPSHVPERAAEAMDVDEDDHHGDRTYVGPYAPLTKAERRVQRRWTRMANQMLMPNERLSDSEEGESDDEDAEDSGWETDDGGARRAMAEIVRRAFEGQ